VKSATFWNVMPHSPAEIYWHSYETSLKLHGITFQKIVKDSSLCCHRHEGFRSHMGIFYVPYQNPTDPIMNVYRDICKRIVIVCV
jgi:hypothetical protein